MNQVVAVKDPLDLSEIAPSPSWRYEIKFYVQDGCGVKPAIGVWCGACIHSCWITGADRWSPFRNNSTVVGRAVAGESCSRCEAMKGGR